MLFGSNLPTPVAGCTARRAYLAPADGIPAAYSATMNGQPAIPPGIVPCVSVKPDPAAVAAGSLDKELTAYWRSFPPGSLVTLHHERNDPGEGQHAPVITAADAHCVALIRAHRIPVRYGAILGMWPVSRGQQVAGWYAADVAWVGFDGYQQRDASLTAEKVFGSASAQCAAHSPAARQLITETNTGLDQAAWFTDVLRFAQERRMAGVLWYADHAGTGQPPLLPAALQAELAVRAATAGI